jgi:ribosomal protein S18 acetylase RimI-like enzyme
MGRAEALDRVAFAAWPAEEAVALGEWRLRFMHGVSRRGNSVWPGAAERHDAAPLLARVEDVEGWYAARGVPAMFQLDPARHPELDAFLAARGYAIDAPVSVQVADARNVLGADTTRRGAPGAAPSNVTSNAVSATVSRVLTDAWLEISARRGRFARMEATYRKLLDRIGERARYALVEIDGRPAAVGMGVIDGPWLGVFSMLTVPEARRRGGARTALAGLAAEALSCGVPELYLLVERDNAPARELYDRASFRELGGYHYRVAPPR